MSVLEAETISLEFADVEKLHSLQKVKTISLVIMGLETAMESFLEAWQMVYQLLLGKGGKKKAQRWVG